MKLAEALLLRRELLKSVAGMRERIEQNALVQEGDSPSEEPELLLQKALGLLQQEASLVIRINRTNMDCTLSDGRTMMEVLAHRDRLINEQAVLKSAIESTYRERYEYEYGMEIKRVNVVNVAALQEWVDELDVQLRNLNAAIQETNWLTELKE